MLLYHRRNLDQKGQGMTEYIIIVALVAVAAIAVVALFGGKIKSVFTKSTQAIENVEGVAGDDQNISVDEKE